MNLLLNQGLWRIECNERKEFIPKIINGPIKNENWIGASPGSRGIVVRFNRVFFVEQIKLWLYDADRRRYIYSCRYGIGNSNQVAFENKRKEKSDVIILNKKMDTLRFYGTNTTNKSFHIIHLEVYGIPHDNFVVSPTNVSSICSTGIILDQLSARSIGLVYGIKNHEIFRLVNNSKLVKLPGGLKHISCGVDGEIWGVNRDNNIYRWNGNPHWIEIPGGLVQISCGSRGHVWGVNSSDMIYTRDVGNNSWVQIEGRLVRISVNSRGLVYGVNRGGDFYRRVTNKWEKINCGIKLRRCEVGEDGVVGCIGEDGETYAWFSNVKKMKCLSSVVGRNLKDFFPVGNDTFYVISSDGIVRLIENVAAKANSLADVGNMFGNSSINNIPSWKFHGTNISELSDNQGIKMLEALKLENTGILSKIQNEYLNANENIDKKIAELKEKELEAKYLEKMKDLDKKSKEFADGNECSICFDRKKDTSLNCGHVFCSECCQKFSECPNCREKVTSRTKLFF